MKKILLALCLLAVTSAGFTQTCEQREDKLLGIMGSLSAGFLYNTYGLIGSIADGFSHDAYDETTTTDLLNAQKKLADNMITLFEKIIGENALKDQKDKDYLAASVAIIKGFKTQVDLLLKVVKNNSKNNLDNYETQRTKSWKDISQLMGIKE